MFRLLFIGCILPATAALAAAQARPEPPRKLLLSANPLPTPVLRLTLLPELRHQEPGDAWPLYQQAGEQLSKLSLDLLPREDTQRILNAYREPLLLLEQACRREACNPDYPERLRVTGFNTLLPELQQLRSVIPVVNLKARLELAEGRPEQALQTLQVGYSLGKRLGESSTLISQLVGVAITTQTNDVLLEILSAPQTPNLYWALANLPRPFLSLHKAMEGERLAVYGQFAALGEVARDLDAGPLPGERMRKVVKEIQMLLDRPDNFAMRLLLAQQIRLQHETAKEALIAAGRPRAKVEAWPPLQVALMFGLLEFDQHLDEMMKWDGFPYYEAAKELDEVGRKLRSLRRRPLEMRAFPLGITLLPAIEKVTQARSRLDRQFASLRCVEAIRLYAAGHGGELPAVLADVREVPLPVCPVTGRNFKYQRRGATAILSAPEVPKEVQASIKPLVYEITIRH